MERRAQEQRALVQLDRDVMGVASPASAVRKSSVFGAPRSPAGDGRALPGPVGAGRALPGPVGAAQPAPGRRNWAAYVPVRFQDGQELSGPAGYTYTGQLGLPSEPSAGAGGEDARRWRSGVPQCDFEGHSCPVVCPLHPINAAQSRQVAG